MRIIGLLIFCLACGPAYANQCVDTVGGLSKYRYPDKATHDASLAAREKQFVFLAYMAQGHPELIGVAKRLRAEILESGKYRIIDSSEGDYCSEEHKWAVINARVYAGIYNENLLLLEGL